MKYLEIKSKTEKELQDLLKQLGKKLFNLRFQQSSGELTNASEFRKTRKTIARIKTHLNSIVADSSSIEKIKESNNA